MKVFTFALALSFSLIISGASAETYNHKYRVLGAGGYSAEVEQTNVTSPHAFTPTANDGDVSIESAARECDDAGVVCGSYSSWVSDVVGQYQFFNFGGNTYTDISGQDWIGCRIGTCPFLSSSAGNFVEIVNNTTIIPGTNDPLLYREIIEQNSGGAGAKITIDVPIVNGSYEVTLLFAEYRNLYTNPGDRVIDIIIEGTTVESNLDFFLETGAPDTAFNKSYTAVVSDESLTVELVTVADGPIISGMSIGSGTTQAPTAPTNTQLNSIGLTASYDSTATWQCTSCFVTSTIDLRWRVDTNDWVFVQGLGTTAISYEWNHAGSPGQTLEAQTRECSGPVLCSAWSASGTTVLPAYTTMISAGPFEIATIPEPPDVPDMEPGMTLPLSDGNNYRSTAQRVAYRSVDTVLSEWQANAIELPPCDVVFTNATHTLADIVSEITDNPNSYSAFCFGKGNSWAGASSMSLGAVCPSSQCYLMADDSPYVQGFRKDTHPSQLADADRAIVPTIEFVDTPQTASGNWLIHRLAIRASTASARRDGIRIDNAASGVNLTVGHVDIQGGRGIRMVTAQGGVSWSTVTSTTRTPGTTNSCIEIGSTSGGTGTGEGVWIAHNDIWDCAGHGVSFAGNDAAQNGGNVVDANTIRSTQVQYTDCAGNITGGMLDRCQAMMSGIALESGNSSQAVDTQVKVLNNYLDGFRFHDSLAAGAEQWTGPIDVAGSSAHALISKNTINNSNRGIGTSRTQSSGTYLGPRQTSFNGNRLSLMTLDDTNLSAHVIGSQAGIALNQSPKSEAAFNTLYYSALAFPTPTYFGIADQQVLGNVFQNGGITLGSASNPLVIDCNTYINITADQRLPDQNTSYAAGTTPMLAKTVFTQPVLGPVAVDLANMQPPADAPFIDLCENAAVDDNYGADDPGLAP